MIIRINVNIFLKMSEIFNFKSFEVSAETKEAAVAQVEKENFHINGDATQAWKKFHEKNAKVTSNDEKEFKLEYLKKKTKNAPGSGFIVTLSSAVVSTRERPWKVVDIKTEGKRDTQKKFDLVDHDTKEVLKTLKSERVKNEKAGEAILDKDGNDTGRVEPDTKVIRPTKTAAKEMAKALIKKGFKGQIDIVQGKESIGSDPVVATVTYTPSKSTKNGRYMFFGLEF